MTVASVYVHFPWCLHRCAYCDFATAVAATIPRDAYLMAIQSELVIRTENLPTVPIDTVFFGGGTPSLWGPNAIASVLKWLNSWAGIAKDAEITLEANPGATEAAQLAEYAAIGVTRVSIGVQALDDGRLKALDRLHNAEGAHKTLKSLANLLSAGKLQSANADLMFGAPGQGIAELRGDVEQLLAYDLPHVSAYGLTVEAGTPLARQVAQGRAQAPDETLQTEMLELLPELLAARGLQRYEVSNFAKPGQQCRHNLAYWQGRHYLAVGVGAHGFLPAQGAIGLRYGNERKQSVWQRALEQSKLCEEFREVIDPGQHLLERVLTGLRLRQGLHLGEVAARLGDQAVIDLLARARPGLDRGDLWHYDGHLGVEPRALRLLDRLLLELA